MAMLKNEAELKAKADASAKRAMEALSPSALYAISCVAPNVRNGVFWGFTKVRDVQKHAEDIQSERSILARKIGDDDVIIEVSPKYIVDNVMAVAPDVFTQKDFDLMNQNMASAVVEFQKFLLYKGIKQPGFGSTIGIYCVNKVTTIAYKGVNYPAFRLNMEKALDILGSMGYSVRVGGSFISARDAMQSGRRLWDSAVLSGTKTGVFIDVKSTYSPEQLKGIKAQLDARYGK